MIVPAVDPTTDSHCGARPRATRPRATGRDRSGDPLRKGPVTASARGGSWWPWCVLGILWFGAAGCGGARVYHASTLPAELRVAPTTDTSVVNLTRLAGPTGKNSLIGRGDLLELTIVTGYETDRLATILVRVDEGGSVHVPLVGPVPVAGLEPAEAEQNIGALAVQRGVYEHPYVTVMIKRQRVSKVTVVGAVETPGTYELPQASSDLLGALAAAGGLTEEAGLQVEVMRKSGRVGPAMAPPGSGPNPANKVANSLAGYPPGQRAAAQPVTYRVSLEQISEPGTQNYTLGDGDVVMVFPRQSRVVHVMGLVRKPDQFEIPPHKDLYLLDALAMAGGRTMQLADTVRIIRRPADGSEPVVIMASVREAKTTGQANIRLAPGDLVSVEETPATFVLDTFRNLVRFGFSVATPFF